MINNANNIKPKNFRYIDQDYELSDAKHGLYAPFDFTDGCFGFRKGDTNALQYQAKTPCPSSPEECISRTFKPNDDNLDNLYFPVMFGSGHLLPVVSALGKSLSVQELESALRSKTNQKDNDLHIDVFATQFNKKKIIIHSLKTITELENAGIKHINGTYTLKFNYEPNEENIIGLQVDIENEKKIIPLLSLVPSPSLAFKIGAGVLASLSGVTALTIGALAVAAILTTIAPPIALALIVVGTMALLTGIGLFAKAALTKTPIDNGLIEDPSLNNKC